MKKFPPKIIVSIDNNGDEDYLIANETSAELDDGTLVGVYQFVAAFKQKVTKELVPQKETRRRRSVG
jgi:hypothetical protein